MPYQCAVEGCSRGDCPACQEIEAVTERLHRLASWTEDFIKAAHQWPEEFAAFVVDNESDFQWQINKMVDGTLDAVQQSFGVGAKDPLTNRYLRGTYRTAVLQHL